MVIECPMNDYECPYFENGDCRMWWMEHGADPREECDAFDGLEEEDGEE